MMAHDLPGPVVVDLVASLIRDVADFPQPGITFKDISPLLGDAAAFAAAVQAMAQPFEGAGIDAVVGIEARGFIVGVPVAQVLGAGFVPVRKAGKLPGPTIGAAYDLEYGAARIEVHADAFGAGDRVLVVDDVLATGGTAAAAVGLVRRIGGTPVGLSVLIELLALDGRTAVGDLDVTAVLQV